MDSTSMAFCIFGIQNTFYIAHNYIADTVFKVIFVQTFYIISFGLQVLFVTENIIHHLFPEWQYSIPSPLVHTVS